MKLKLVIPFLSLFFLSCRIRNTNSIKVLTYLIINPLNTDKYSYYTFRARQDSTANSSDEGSNYVKFKYPYFENQNDLNNRIMHKLVTEFAFEHADTSYQQFAKSFFSLNKDNLPINVSDKSLFHSVDEYAAVLSEDKDLLTIGFAGYLTQENSRHLTSFLNWNTKTNKVVDFNDLFKIGYESVLPRVAESIFFQDKESTDTSEFPQDYPFKYYHDKTFILTKNYYVTPSGLNFLYNKGEISLEEYLLVVPYSKIKSLLKPNTVLAQYLH